MVKLNFCGPFDSILFWIIVNLKLGNDGGYFSLDPRTGQLYQIKEIDLESMSTDKFELEIEAVQLDNPLKNAQAKVYKLMNS